MTWSLTHQGDVECGALADRHYSRRKIGAPIFVPPARSVVLKQPGAVWVTSWPKPEYVKHRWIGAWVNSLFRTEHGSIGERASVLIREAVAATRAEWPNTPELGIVSFIDPRHVTPRRIRSRPTWGHSYFEAGFIHVGYSQGGLWAMQLMPDRMPAPEKAYAAAPLLELA